MAGQNDVVWLDVLPSMRNFGVELAKGVRKESEKVSDTEGKKFGERFSGAAAKATKVAAGGVLALGGAGIAATKGLYQLGSTYADVSNKIQQQTGASGAKLNELQGTVRNMAMATGQDMATVTDSVLAVRGSITGMADASGKELQDVTVRAQAFSQAFEIDVTRASQVAGQMMKNGMAKDGVQAFDLLTAAAQKVPPALREDILDAVDEYGPAFRQAGMSGEQMMGALVKGSEKGMFGIDKTGDAIKELGIRMTTADTGAAEAAKSIGLNYDKLAAGFAKGGAEGSKAFKSIVNGLQAIEDPAKRATAAQAMFGTPLEDLGAQDIPKFLDGLESAAKGMDGFAGASGKLADSVNSGPQVELGKLRNTLAVMLAPAAERVFKLLNDGAVWLNTNAVPAVQKFVAEWEKGTGTGGRYRDMAQDLFDKLKAGLVWVKDHHKLAQNLAASLVALGAAYKLVRAGMAVYHAAHVVGIALSKAYKAAKVEEGVAVDASGRAALRARLSQLRHSASTAASTAAAKANAAAHKLVNGAMSGGRWVAERGKILAHRGAQMASTAAAKANAAGHKMVNGAMAGGRWVAERAKIIAHRGAQLVSTAATKGMALAQRGLNLVMKMNPIGLVIAALIALGVWLVRTYKTNDEFKRKVDNGFRTIKRAGESMWNFLRDKVLKPMQTFFLTTIPNAAKKLSDGVTNHLKALRGAAAKPVLFIVETVYQNGIRATMGKIPGVSLPDATGAIGALKKYQGGGMVQGSWSSARRDHVLGVGADGTPTAWVEPEEFVTNRRATKKSRNLLEAINRGVITDADGMVGGMGLGRFAGGGYVWPTTTRAMSGNYAGHSGVDIPVPIGTPLFATEAGRIAYTGYGRGYGNAIFLNGSSGVPWVYGHGSRPLVSAGQTVAKGQQIGLSGNTGRSTGPHLHIEAAAGGFARSSNRGYTLGLLGGSTTPKGGFMSALGDAWAWAKDKAAKLKDEVLGKLGGISLSGMLGGGSSDWGQMLQGGVRGWIDQAKKWAKDKIKPDLFGGGDGTSSGAPAGAGVERWRDTVKQALGMVGLPQSDDYVNAWLRQIKTESGGNEKAVQGNIGDINNRTGNLARGLVQVIPPTFNAYKMPGYNDPFNGLHSLLAGMRYAKSRYRNMLAVIGHGHGYKTGTGNAFPGLAALSEDGAPELVVGRQWRAMQGGERVLAAGATRQLLGASAAPTEFHGILSLDEDGDAYIRMVAEDVAEDYMAAAGRN